MTELHFIQMMNIATDLIVRGKTVLRKQHEKMLQLSNSGTLSYLNESSIDQVA